MSNKPTFVTSLGGRDVQVRVATDTQIALMGRASKRAEQAYSREDGKAAIYHIADALDIIENLIVKEDDRQYLVDLMSKGELGVEEILSAVEANTPGTQTAAKPVARVARGKAAK